MYVQLESSPTLIISVNNLHKVTIDTDQPGQKNKAEVFK